MNRYYAKIAPPKSEPRLRHYIGFPSGVGPGSSSREYLAWPRILTVEPCPDGGLILDRFSAAGDPVGDTWHRDFEEAKHQAATEYGESLGPWREVPESVEDVVAFALKS